MSDRSIAGPSTLTRIMLVQFQLAQLMGSLNSLIRREQATYKRLGAGASPASDM
jgi:hypothetical protein